MFAPEAGQRGWKGWIETTWLSDWFPTTTPLTSKPELNELSSSVCLVLQLHTGAAAAMTEGKA